MGTGSQKHDTAPVENGPHAHGQTPTRYFTGIGEVAAIGLNRLRIGCHNSRTAPGSTARFIKSDMAIATQSQKPQINSSQPANLSLKGQTLLFGFPSHAVEDKRIPGTNIQMPEKVLLHKKAKALLMIPIETEILVEVDSAHLGEAEPSLAVQANQLVIGRLRRRTGS